MSLRFELGVWVDDTPVPLSQCTQADVLDATAALFIEIDARELVGAAWSLGDFARIVDQLAAAVARLESGQFAIVRSADDSADSVPYFCFRPRGDSIDLTLFFVTAAEGDVSSVYPIEYSGDPAKLYSWVESVGDGLLDRLPDDLHAAAWGPIEVPRRDLLAQMRATLERAKELGIDFAAPATVFPARPVVPLPTGNKRDAREMVQIDAATFRVGLTSHEADKLAEELARMEERLRENESSLKGFALFDLESVIRTRREWLEAAVPAHDVAVGPFAIDIYPVTVLQWRQYMRDAGVAAPQRPLTGDATFVGGISWNDANAYARYYDLDLPTEAEWELAARVDRRFFTWGDHYFPEGELAFHEPLYDPYVVGSRPMLANSRGIHDLIGQFGEYCSDRFAPYPGTDLTVFNAHFPHASDERVVRGGYDVYQDATCAARRGVDPAAQGLTIKFRCVRRT